MILVSFYFIGPSKSSVSTQTACGLDSLITFSLENHVSGLQYLDDSSKKATLIKITLMIKKTSQ
jgi:hypothetical protein